MVFLSFSLAFLLSLPQVAAPLDLPQITSLNPVLTSTTGPEVVYTVRAQVLDLREFPNLWLTWQVSCDGVHQGWSPARWLSPGDEVNLVEATIAGTYDTSFSLPPSATCLVTIERVTFDVTVPEWRLTVGLETFPPLRFETAAVGTPVGTVGAHPFEAGILGLGLPVGIVLGFIGLIWLLLTFLVVAVFRMDPDTSISALMVIVSFNIFMRFWPTIFLVLLSFLLGFLVVREFKGAGTVEE